MGLMGSTFSIMVGTLCGVYISQNYNIPNIRKLANSGFTMAKHVEETYRKPKTKTKTEDEEGLN
ncbi:hypothetical protein I3760_13G032600 [Carya illinoinensis]|nr:hypothetical protein I3760_13G032600 [Carya illinoinensis]